MSKKDDLTLATPARDNPEVRQWLHDIQESLEREKEYRKEARVIVRMYESAKPEDAPFNILYSNTDTISPALYNNVPEASVKRRFKDADPVGKAAGQVLERSLDFLIDSGDDECPDLDTAMRQSVLEALLTDRGMARIKYNPTFKPGPAGPDGKPTQVVASETVYWEGVPWDGVVFGYAKVWKKVPWLAFIHLMTKDEVEAEFGAEAARAVPYNIKGAKDEDMDEGDQKKVADAQGEQFARIFEVWDKSAKQTFFIADGYGDYLKKVDQKQAKMPDPLRLQGFFPMPEPLSFYAKSTSMVPIPQYLAYKQQATELNVITTRITKITRALKIRGFYDSTLEGLKDLMEADDNTLKPAENVSAMLQGQTLEKAIWFFPLETLVGVLQQLYVQRQQVKDVIYEITGVSDILRGASVASETATAQNIKNQWGTLRLKRSQKAVGMFARGLLRLAAELVGRFGQDTLAKMTGMQFPTEAQKQQGQIAMTQYQQQAMAAQQAGQQPPPPPPQLQQLLSTPSWEDILAVLTDDIQRNYSIDIETNSTVDVEATEDKEEIAEFMNAMAQFLNGVMPIVEQGFMSFDTVKTILLTITRRFRFGEEVEDQINAMQAPPPKPDPNAAKAQQDAQAHQQDMQAKQLDAQRQAFEFQQQQQAAARQAEIDQQAHAARMQELAMEAQYKVAEHQMKMEELAARRAEIGMNIRATQAQTIGTIATADAKVKSAKQNSQRPTKGN
jgi:hypothetical protein